MAAGIPCFDLALPAHHPDFAPLQALPIESSRFEDPVDENRMLHMNSTSPEIRRSIRENRFAMRLSLIFGLLMVFGKGWAYVATGSTAIFSDAAESVVHVVAVVLAAFSLWLSTRPASQQFSYGYERISFLSAGFEGALIILAAVVILVTAIENWESGLILDNLGLGTIVVCVAGLINACLGWFILRTGKRNSSLILEANGYHILADSWTSLGIVGGLCLVLLTGWQPFDPIFAIAVAIHILWSGAQLVWRSIGGLMDYSDPNVGRNLRKKLDRVCKEARVGYHGARFRHTGHRLQIELHLLFPFNTPLGEAHRRATIIERKLQEALDQPAEVFTHLESFEDHQQIHSRGHRSKLPL